MSTVTFKQFAIIESKSAEDFEKELNEKLIELSAYSPTVNFSPSNDKFARIEYQKKFIKEEPQTTETGIRFTCGECPLFEPPMKRDGTPDGRIKYGGCEFAEMERTWRDSSACELLYQMIRNGSIHLAKASIEKK